MKLNRNLVDMYFNNWHVLYYDEEREKEQKRKGTKPHRYWVCQCSCGVIKSVLENSLLSGRSKSCGCSSKTGFIDLSNREFGEFKVLRRDIEKEEIERKELGKSRTYWICQCSCGNIISVDSATLRTGGMKHCGCKRYRDLSGEHFGYFEVLYRDFELEEEKRKISGKKSPAYWKCRCVCGTIKSIRYSHLVFGGTKSCGCIVSYGEKKIKEILNKNNIKFKHNISLPNAYSFKGSNLKFDFIIESDKNSKYIIEFDGEQHFGYTGRDWSTKEHFEEYRKNDILKDTYCFKNNIPLIRIPFVFLDNIKLEDLLLESSNFILTKENEKVYYKTYTDYFYKNSKYIK